MHRNVNRMEKRNTPNENQSKIVQFTQLQRAQPVQKAFYCLTGFTESLQKVRDPTWPIRPVTKWTYMHITAAAHRDHPTIESIFVWFFILSVFLFCRFHIFVDSFVNMPSDRVRKPQSNWTTNERKPTHWDAVLACLMCFASNRCYILVAPIQMQLRLSTATRKVRQYVQNYI